MLVPLVWLLWRRPRGPLARWTWLLGLFLILACYLMPYNVNHPALQQGWRALLAYGRLYGAWLILLFCIDQLWRAPQRHAT